MTTYIYPQDFITHELEPCLNGFTDDYDLSALFDEVAEYDGKGWVWKEKYADSDNPAAFQKILPQFDISDKNAIC